MDAELQDAHETRTKPQDARLKEENKARLRPYSVFLHSVYHFDHVIYIYFTYCVYTHTHVGPGPPGSCEPSGKSSGTVRGYLLRGATRKPDEELDMFYV